MKCKAQAQLISTLNKKTLHDPKTKKPEANKTNKAAPETITNTTSTATITSQHNTAQHHTIQQSNCKRYKKANNLKHSSNII